MSQYQIKHSRHFATPPAKERIHFNKSEKKQFRKLLKQHKITKHGNKKHGFCNKVRSKDNIFIENTITKEPELIAPYQISFLLYYGYLPKYDKSKGNNKLTVSHRCGCNRCINPLHLLIEEFWKNILRRTHHDEIRKLSKSKNRSSSAKYYYLTHSNCNCTPYCFVSFNQT